MSADRTGTRWDAVVVGGGVMGCAAAVRLAEGGMRVALVEATGLGLGASGVNAGTLSLQIKRVALMPYALRGHALWKAAGDKVGYREKGGLTLAFTDREAELLTERMTARQKAGAPIEIIGPDAAAAREPNLSPHVRLASWCPADGYANSSLTGAFYRGRLQDAGVTLMEGAKVTGITPEAGGAEVRLANGETLQARRLLLATGAWTAGVAGLLGVSLPVRARINTVSVTERMPRLLRSTIGHATGLLTLKQSANGTVLIGGGWQGTGAPEDGRGAISVESLVNNLRLAAFAAPGLRAARVLRSWTGFEANTPDFYPLAGALPGWPDIFVLAAVRGGYTIGPYIGALMGDLMLGREPELPLFDPARFNDLGAANDRAA